MIYNKLYFTFVKNGKSKKRIKILYWFENTCDNTYIFRNYKYLSIYKHINISLSKRLEPTTRRFYFIWFEIYVVNTHKIVDNVIGNILQYKSGKHVITFVSYCTSLILIFVNIHSWRTINSFLRFLIFIFWFISTSLNLLFPFFLFLRRSERYRAS